MDMEIRRGPSRERHNSWQPFQRVLGGIGQGKVETQESGIMKKNRRHTWSGEKADGPKEAGREEDKNEIQRKWKLYSGTFIEKEEGERNRAESGFQVYGVFLVLNRIHQNGSIRSGQSMVPGPSLRSGCPRVTGGYLDRSRRELL
jgi:hypothetical protein